MRAPLQRNRDGESGLATLELALLMPTLLFLFAGVLTVGHLVYVRNELTQQANQIARACVVQRELDQASCEALGRSALDRHSGESWYETCGGVGGTRVTAPVDTETDPGALKVTVYCDYAGIVAPELLSSKDADVEMDLSELDVKVTATLPFALKVEEPLLLDP